MNKLSEEHIRKEKVQKLKEKVLKEIEKKLEENRKELRFYLEELNEEEKTDYRLLMNEIFYLFQLKEYMECEYTFLEWHKKSEKDDYIIYVIDDMNIDIWLQETFHFTSHILFNIEEIVQNSTKTFDIFSILDANYFAYDFTTVFEKILFEEKLKEKN